MSKYTDLAMERRSQFTPEGRPAWNCCQAVVSVFAQDAGYDEDACMKAATYFRGGMQIGPKDGGYYISLTDGTFKDLISSYLRPVNAMIRECISYVEEILREKGKLGDR